MKEISCSASSESLTDTTTPMIWFALQWKSLPSFTAMGRFCPTITVSFSVSSPQSTHCHVRVCLCLCMCVCVSMCVCVCLRVCVSVSVSCLPIDPTPTIMYENTGGRTFLGCALLYSGSRFVTFWREFDVVPLQLATVFPRSRRRGLPRTWPFTSRHRWAIPRPSEETPPRN